MKLFAIMVSWQQGRVKGGGGVQLLLPLKFFQGKREEKVQSKMDGEGGGGTCQIFSGGGGGVVEKFSRGSQVENSPPRNFLCFLKTEEVQQKKTDEGVIPANIF